ncbi:MAG: hypothetical protein ACI4EV_05925 [Lachnospiraceae bacterium]
MSYGYSSTGAYRKAKWWIDIASIVISLAIIVTFILSFWVDFFREYRFVLIFGMGAAVNGLAGMRRLMDSYKTAGIVLLVIGAALLVMMLLCILAGA